MHYCSRKWNGSHKMTRDGTLASLKADRKGIDIQDCIHPVLTVCVPGAMLVSLCSH